jgi:hypothetical protein
MCKWGDTKPLEVTVPAHLSSTGKPKRKIVGVDSCIYEIVKALNDGGVYTDACCCGHGKQPGDIILGDGRELIIAQNYEIARKVDKAFPPIN